MTDGSGVMADTGTVAFRCLNEAAAHTFIRPVVRTWGDNWRFADEDADRCPVCGHHGEPISERVHVP